MLWWTERTNKHQTAHCDVPVCQQSQCELPVLAGLQLQIFVGNDNAMLELLSYMQSRHGNKVS